MLYGFWTVFCQFLDVLVVKFGQFFIKKCGIGVLTVGGFKKEFYFEGSPKFFNVRYVIAA